MIRIIEHRTFEIVETTEDSRIEYTVTGKIFARKTRVDGFESLLDAKAFVDRVLDCPGIEIQPTGSPTPEIGEEARMHNKYDLQDQNDTIKTINIKMEGLRGTLESNLKRLESRPSNPTVHEDKVRETIQEMSRLHGEILHTWKKISDRHFGENRRLPK